MPDVESLTRQLSNLEIRVDNNNTKVELKLEQLVHLMQVVASLQEKQSHSEEHISDLKTAIKDLGDKFERSTDRIHQRFDSYDDKDQKDIDAFFEKNREMDGKINKTNAEIEKWTNRGIGLWAGVSALMVIAQSVGGYFLSEFKTEYEKTKAQITTISTRQNDLENDITRISTTVRQSK